LTEVDLLPLVNELVRSPEILGRLSPEAKKDLMVRMEGMLRDEHGWPKAFIHRDTKRVYRPHTLEESVMVYTDEPRYAAILGGEGSGKSTAGIIKDLNRIRRNMSGLMCSPSLPHFQRSLWKEFQRWCPWDLVIPSHRRMGDLSWMPVKPCDVVFENGSYIHCVGVKNAGSLEGPNLSWMHFDEARHHPDKSAITVTDGRVRIPGPNDEMPQLWFTTTPRMNWLFDYFGPVQCKCNSCGAAHRGEYGIEIQTGVELKCPKCGSENLEIDDPLYALKLDSMVVRLTTDMNEANTMEDFARVRAQTLTDSEAEVLIGGKWAVIEEGQPFLPSVLWWDHCREDLPPLDDREPVVIALDAATGREVGDSDCFAICGITRHPSRPDDSVAVRFTKTWQVRAGEKLDYQGTEDNPGPERFLLRLCGFDLDADKRIVPSDKPSYNVIRVVYDPRELHDMSQRLMREGVASFREFGQMSQREEADRQLLTLITQKRLSHNGDRELRQHIQYADRKLDSTGKKLRIVKRTKNARIDLAVVVSMGSFECLRMNL